MGLINQCYTATVLHSSGCDKIHVPHMSFHSLAHIGSGVCTWIEDLMKNRKISLEIDSVLHPKYIKLYYFHLVFMYMFVYMHVCVLSLE